VEIVRRAIEAFNRGDFRLVAQLCDSDLDRGRGHDLSRRRYVGALRGWDIRYIDAGEDSVAVLTRLVGAGKRSGVPVDREVGLVYRLRDGRLWRVRSYLEVEDALEAAQLSEGRDLGV